MFKIEKIGENIFYIKALGTFPKSVAKRFVKEFKEKTKDLTKISAIFDGLDFILLDYSTGIFSLNTQKSLTLKK